MSAKAIYEATGKRMLYRNLACEGLIQSPFVEIDESSQWEEVAQNNPWLQQQALVVKPDQLIKRRGKLGLIKVNADFSAVKEWTNERIGKIQQVESTKGRLKHFIIEPFLAHKQEEEAYVCIYSSRSFDTILFHHEGGVDIGDVDAKALKLDVPVVGAGLSKDTVKSSLLKHVPAQNQELVAQFILALYKSYVDLFFTYLEINPLVITGGKVYILDLAAKLDATAEFMCKGKWGEVDFPPPFGRDALPEEAYIADLDSKSGASLKLTILNKAGRIWTMVAGGGASVIYSDTICDLGGASELANYGEYSGAPSESQTYEYAKTILGLMTEGPPVPQGKVLIIGGSIANFTNVAATFKGIVKALHEYQLKLQEHNVSIYVRRGGPNYQEGLRVIREVGGSLGINIHVFGPDTHMTAVVGMAMGKRPVPPATPAAPTTANFLLGSSTTMSPLWQSVLPSHTVAGPTLTPFNSSQITPERGSTSDSATKPQVKSSAVKNNTTNGSDAEADESSTASGNGSSDTVTRDVSRMSVDDAEPTTKKAKLNASPSPSRKTSSSKASAAGDNSLSNGHGLLGPKGASGKDSVLFSHKTKAVVWGLQSRAVQSMLDFDFVCERSSPSVVAMTYPMSGDHKQKFYWGQKEILIPVYKNMEDAFKKHPDASVLVSFASLRSAYDSSMEALKFPQVRTIAIIAEGIPENMTRKIIHEADKQGITVIGPATVGGIKPGAFKIGNTGGMMDNILASKLYRSGSVAYVSRSGGMSNELNNIIGQQTNGVYEGVAIGGDRYPGSVFMDHLMRYEADPNVKMLVMLGEVGGIEEYGVIEAVKSGKLKKPLVAWCIGTCAGMFSSEVQFGHAGACANAVRETAVAKNQALSEAGVHVPRSFDELGDVIRNVYKELVNKGEISEKEEQPPPAVPMDYSWARELGLIRKPASFMTSICDERGNELLYGGMPITKIFAEDVGIGGVLSLLWFQRRLPKFAAKFIEMCLIVTADHGPAVSGAHNAIVCARAGKDLISSLASGLLTIGDRFGGALDGAAKQFSEAYDAGMIPMDFVNSMRKQGKLIMGIGHRVKSINNPDMRVKILKEYVKAEFPSSPLLDYAMEVEKITTSKKPNLILNVDGVIGVAFVDLLRNTGCFTREEAQEYVDIGTLNGLFVLGRSMGFIGHYLDQKRLKQGLYRHPWDDITYVMPELSHQ